MARNYDETYLDGLIAKAKKSWEGVDVDSYMSDLRIDMETISNYPMNVTDCYKCGYFLKGGHFTCQKFPHPHNVEHPTDDPNARYLVPAPVTWRNPDGKDIHCNSFVEYVKDTLF